MAMLVAAGFLDNLCLEAEGRRILVKGRTSEGDGHGGGQPRRRRSTGRSSRPPWSPWTCTAARSPTSPHKTARPIEPRPEALPSLYRETAGPRFVWTQHPYKGRKVVKMQITMTLEACCRCGQPIAPGEPAMQTASVDIIGGTGGLLPGEVLPPAGQVLRRRAKRRESLPNAA